MTVEDYLDRATRRRWQWGRVDCTLFCGDWALAHCGRDPGEGIRGTYSSADEAQSIVDRAGGIVAFIGQRLEAIGWERLYYPRLPQEGDIGVIEAPGVPVGNIMLIPAIRLRDRWVARGIRGLSAGPFNHRAFWRAPC